MDTMQARCWANKVRNGYSFNGIGPFFEWYVRCPVHDLPTCKLFKDVPKGIIFDKIHTNKPAKASLAYQ